MAKHNLLPDLEIVRELFDYQPRTGNLIVRNTGHIVQSETVEFEGKGFGTARVIWYWTTGNDPAEKFVEHKDLNRQNNRWENLRLANPYENGYNQPARGKLPKGVNFKGDIPRAKPWYARIRKDGKRIVLGNFATMEEAAKAYQEAADKLHGEFARY